KARIFARCDTAVINLDDPLVMAMPRAASRTLGFSLRAAISADYAVAMHEREWWLTRLGAPLMPVSAMKIRGLHNAANALAARAALPGDTVLLSPACASLDMFRDYGHRGAVFTQAVQELAA